MNRTRAAADNHRAELEIGRRRIELTSLDKVLWPQTGHTKRDLIEYYRRIAPTLLPHIAGRPLTLGRFPDGVEAPGFAQTECWGRPDWMATRRIRLASGETRNFCMANDAASLVWLANQNAIELHAFPATGADLERPGAVVFDLDPGPGCDLYQCPLVALRLRKLLADLGLVCFAKTSGVVGLHLLVPVEAPGGYGETKRFARRTAARLAAELPGDVTASLGRSERVGRVLVDWSPNDRRRTLAVPYSLRATPWPLVSTPLRWDEVEAAAERGAEATAFTARQVLDRVEREGDPWRAVMQVRQKLRT